MGISILVKIWMMAGSMQPGEKNSHCRYSRAARIAERRR